MITEIPYGYCHCGCNQLTSIIPHNRSKLGLIKGEPQKFLKGHKTKVDRMIHSAGYILILLPEHPRSYKGYVYEHIIVAEQKFGGPLPKGAEVHHCDENKANNNPDNLTICKDRLEHELLHKQIDAFNACGNKNWRKCVYCKQYDEPTNLVFAKQKLIYHKNCHSAYVTKTQRDRTIKKREL